MTARMDADAARRLRVAAAKRGIYMGALLDELVFENLPPVEPELEGVGPAKARVRAWDIDRLGQEMARSGISQSDVARELDITPRAVSEWFERGKVPTARQREIQEAIRRIRASKRKASASK